MKLNKHTDFFPFQPAPPNWFGAGIAHKSDVHQTSFGRICYSSTLKKAFVGLKDFQQVLKRNMRGVKEAPSKRLLKEKNSRMIWLPDTVEVGRGQDVGSATKSHLCVLQ